VTIFEQSGSSIPANAASMILGLVNLFATCLSNIFIDRLGRKPLLYISDGGMIASLSTFGTYSYLKDELTYDLPGIYNQNS
jgi:hypothetical protein